MTTISTDKARQGRRGQHVLYILIASLLLAGLVWVGLEIYGHSIDPTPENAPATTATPATPATPTQPSQ